MKAGENQLCSLKSAGGKQYCFLFMMTPTLAVVVMLAVTAVRSTFRLEGDVHFRELCAEAAEHVLDDMVGPNAKNLVPNFSWQMPVSEMPSQAHKLVWIFVPNFDNRLGSSLNHQPSPIFKLQTISIGHRNRFRKVQKDIFAFVRTEANAAAMACLKIKGQSARCVFLRPMARGSMN